MATKRELRELSYAVGNLAMAVHELAQRIGGDPDAYSLPVEGGRTVAKCLDVACAELYDAETVMLHAGRSRGAVPAPLRLTKAQARALRVVDATPAADDPAWVPGPYYASDPARRVARQVLWRLASRRLVERDGRATSARYRITPTGREALRMYTATSAAGAVS